MPINLVATLRLNDQLTGSLKKIGAVAAVGFGAVTAAAATSVNKFVEFDTAVRRAGAVAGASASELESLRQASLDLGASTSKSATEVAEASGELASAGFNATQILSALPGVIAASEASGESLALAAETVGAALNIWSIDSAEAARVSDVLAEAANASAADINSLGYAFKYAGAPAAALGISLEETTAAIGLITNAGIDGSSAGTALRAALLALNNPAKAQTKLMEKIGFSVKDTSGEFKSLSGIIGSLSESLDGLAADEQVAILGKLVGTEAVSGVLALVNAGTKGLDDLTESLQNSEGASEATAKQILGGIGGAIEELGGTFETLQIKVGEALGASVTEFARFLAEVDFQPIIDGAVVFGEAFLGAVKLVVENSDGIINAIKNGTKVVLALTAGFVAFKAALLIGTAVQAFISLLAAWRAGATLAAAAQAVFNGTLLASPVGLIALAIGSLIGVITLLVLNWDRVTEATRRFWDAIGSGEGAIALILGPIGFLINAGVELATQWDSTKSIWENVWSAIRSSAETSINAVIGLINTLINVINKIPFVEIGNISPVGSAGKSAKAGATNTGRQTRPAAGSTLPGISPLGIRNTLSTDGSHANGLSYVPFDGYTATLHKGEEVLTRAEAEERRQQKRNNDSGIAGVEYSRPQNRNNDSGIASVEYIIPQNRNNDSGIADVGYIRPQNRNNDQGNFKPESSRPQQRDSGAGIRSITIAKLADQIIVREDADINRIADALVAKLTENRGGVTA